MLSVLGALLMLLLFILELNEYLKTNVSVCFNYYAVRCRVFAVDYNQSCHG